MQRSIKITYKRAYKEQANYYEIHLKNSKKFNFRECYEVYMQKSIKFTCKVVENLHIKVYKVYMQSRIKIT